MKRTTLLGSVAAGLMAAAVATPAWAQATTYPEGTDCSAIVNDANKTACINQMNESRQNPASGSTDDSTTPGAVPPGASDSGVNNQPNGTNGGAAPSMQQGGQDAPSQPNGTGNSTGSPSTN